MRRLWPTSRALSALALLTGAALALTACGSADAGQSDSNEADGEAVTIESALGTATIEEPPERVVTLGMGSTGTAIALGVTPVGMEEYPWGSDETGYMPWIHEAVTAAGDELPAQFTGGTELDIEAVLELDPDVILAPWSGITQEQYDLLSDIAPTVAYPNEPWSTDWEEQIIIIGQALGKPEAAEQAIADIEEQLATVAEENREFADTSFVYAYTEGPGTLGVFMPDEQRVAMLRKMGLQLDPMVETLQESGGSGGSDWSLIGLENADRLADADLMFTFYMDEQTRKEVEGQPLYASIPAVERGSLVTSEDAPFVTASSMINPLTVPWSIDRYVPLIEEAIGKLDD